MISRNPGSRTSSSSGIPGITGSRAPTVASERMIAECDAQVLVHCQHAFHHAGQDRFAARALQFQALHQFADARSGALEGAGQQAEVVVAGW